MRCFTISLAAAALVLNTGAAHADIGDQLFKLLASDGATGDFFGHSVAISGEIAIVGAFWDDDNGDASGSAYLYNTTTGIQIIKLLPDDGAVFDFFGHSVGIGGTPGNEIAIVGASLDDDASGSAYLFDATGQQIAKLLAEDGAAGDQFGLSVAMSSTIAIVGANRDDDNGLDSGSAYLFDITTGQQLFKLLPNDGMPTDLFGWSVAIGGPPGMEIAIVGAHHSDSNGSGSGSAYLFDTTTGQQVFKLLPSDGQAGDSFGLSVAIGGTTAIVGAPRSDDTSGSVYLFDTTTGLQLSKSIPEDNAEGDGFGVYVAISGTIAIIGATGDDDNGLDAGSAYLFDVSDPRNPVQIVKLLPDDGAAEDSFGGSVAINADTAIVGASWDDDNGINSGSAYLFCAAPCYADCNCDNVVNTLDFFCYLNQYNTSDPVADCNGDGIVNTLDFLCFLNAYNEGC